MNSIPSHPAFRPAVLAAAGGLLLAVLCGCADGTGSAADPTTSRPPAVQSVTAKAASDPATQISAAETTAAAQGKRVLLDFGADWCPDCRSLDAFYRDPVVAPVLADGFVLVKIDVGHFDQNMDVSHEYGDAAAAGIPALAVLDPDGTMLVNTSDGSFANARDMDPSAVADFLSTWRPTTR